MIIGMSPMMALLPGRNAAGGRAVVGRPLFATCAILVFVPTIFAFVHARASRTSAGAPDPTAIPAGA
jgi:hypothetical protein